MDVVLVVVLLVAFVAGIRYALKVSWGIAIVIAVASAKVLSAMGVGR